MFPSQSDDDAILTAPLSSQCENLRTIADVIAPAPCKIDNSKLVQREIVRCRMLIHQEVGILGQQTRYSDSVEEG